MGGGGEAPLELARDEFENVQVVVTAGAADATGLQSTVEAGEGLEVSLRPVGFVRAGISGCVRPQPPPAAAPACCAHSPPPQLAALGQ